ncbi:PAS domain S-box protein [Salinadaptatus halalkaliphilus]|uniref:PAS domain S-box protein n=1 Tax=Salinadaptatus halalkaliphilus TaxID=2419781 RepID=A0A4S3TSZ5_9EURY|nr:PAS domain S-box protein [Salinadaptatus halalkaliphilus]THE66555.1 PAS domain S-box protein [Salinadaptatus halalkaliphilus]
MTPTPSFELVDGTIAADVDDQLFSATVTVLLVDDDGSFLELVADYLEREYGFETRTETSPSQALERLETESIDCIVSGYRMPEMDGIEFLETVTERYPSIPFVLFAGQGSEAVARKAIRTGATDYLQKDTGETRYELLARRVESCVGLRRQRRQLENLYVALEDAGHATMVTDREGTIVDANATMTTLSGYDRDELLGATPALLGSGEHDRAFYRDLWETILEGDVWTGEVHNERPDGSQYVIDQTIAPITDEAGTIEGFIAINRDITDRKKRERERRRFEQAVEHAGHAVLITGTDGTIEYVNPAFEEITGYSATEAIGETPALLKSGTHDRAFYQDLWGTIRDGEIWQGEVHNERRDGSQYVIDQTIAPITDDAGAIEGFVAINRDITDRKERQQELERFRSAVRHAGHGVMITDTDGTIEYVNEAFEATSGYSAAEAVGRTPALLNSGEHDPAFYQELWETILEGDVWHGEVVNERQDGSEYVVDQTIAPITDGGTIEGFVAINRDITKLKAYERDLENQNERLKQYGQTVAHDLRNPLTLLEAELEQFRLSADRADGAVDVDSVQRQCDEIGAIVERMRTLIDDLLTMAEQGQLVLSAEEISLETTTRVAWDQLETADADLIVDEASIEADPDRLREMLSNLFRNALEHAGDDVTVRVGPLDFADGFFVEDDGPGIVEDDRKQVFDRGFTTADDGTGFGLAIVEQIATAHGWTVVLTDSDAGGARFEFAIDDELQR